MSWEDGIEPEVVPLKGREKLRAFAKMTVIGLVLLAFYLLMLFVRMFEYPIFRRARPISTIFPRIGSRFGFWVIGIKHRTHGKLMTGKGAVVSNHVSWLDIFALNARKRIYFVSKAEVASWPGIGLLAKGAGTVFINRNRHEAKAHNSVFHERLSLGHKLLFFPEGTSTDGRHVLPFKSTLFEAFFNDSFRDILQIQPVTLLYTPPKNVEPEFYGWWGDMDFAPNMLKILGSRTQGSVDVIYHEPVKIADFENRKELAKYCQDVVTAELKTRLSQSR